MIEIGPNLKEAILDFMDKNFQCGRVPGYMLKECFGELLERAVNDGLLNRESETIKCESEEYPTKSGYYWFCYSPSVLGTKKERIVYYCNEYKYFMFIGNEKQYKLTDLKNGRMGGRFCWSGYFVKPVIPISVPKQQVL